MPSLFSRLFPVYWSTQPSWTRMEGKLVCLSACVPNGLVNSLGKKVPLFPSCIHGNWDLFKVTHPASRKDRIAKQISLACKLCTILAGKCQFQKVLSEKHPDRFLSEASSSIASPHRRPFLTLSSCPRFLGALRFFLFVSPTISGLCSPLWLSTCLWKLIWLANAFLMQGRAVQLRRFRDSKGCDWSVLPNTERHRSFHL